jgi:hypothetical protein
MAPVLEVERASGRAARVPLATARGGAERDGVELRIERLEESRSGDPPRRALRAALWIGHALGLRVLAALAVVVLPLAAWRRRSAAAAAPRAGSDLLWCSVALLAAAVASRLALLAVIDASSFPARSSRYLHPVMGPFWAALLLAIHLGRSALRRGRPRAPSP